MQPSKAVVPLGGSGSRMISVTRGQCPKELLNLGSFTLLRRLISELELCGIEDILFILSQDNPETETYLQSLSAETNVIFHRIYQAEKKGLGDALLYADGFIKRNESFYLGFPDDVLVDCDGRPPGLAHYKGIFSGTPIVMADRVPKSEVGKYGILSVSEFEEGYGLVHDVVEKPDPDKAPSDIAIVGRYILDWRIFHFLKKMRTLRKLTASGELDLSHALKCYGSLMYVMVPDNNVRFDCGCPEGYSKAVSFINNVININSNSEGDKPCIS